MRDNTDVVARVKADLEARGVDLVGPCGAFEITRRVAWALRDDGAGVLSKPNGNNCHGHSVDVVCFRDGTWVDVLINAETENRPAWQVGPDKLDPARWVAPANPDGDGQAAPLPGPAVVAADDEIERLITTADRLLDGIEGMTESIDALQVRIVELLNKGIRLRL